MATPEASDGALPPVTIVGAGIAGMSAALRLLEAGFEVTVIEKHRVVGGKFGAVRENGTVHEHAYHFLADWCLNFWDIAGSIGLSRDRHFVRRDSVKFLRPRPPNGRRAGGYDFTELTHGGSLLHFWDNVHSGVIPPNDMIAYAYSLLDLVTEGRQEDPDELEFLNRISVNGFMRSRPYMTDRAALLHQEALLKAFAVPSYETSVRSYRTFVRYFGRDEGGWILKGDCQTTFWDRFLERLQSYRGLHGRRRFQLWSDTSVDEIEVEPDPQAEGALRVKGIRLHGAGREPWMAVQRLILAVPYPEVARLVEQNPLLRERVPGLLDLRQLRSQPMPSLDLYFKRPLPGIPPEHVTLIDDSTFTRGRPRSAGESARRERRLLLGDRGGIASRYGLSFIDNYQAWNDETPPRETWLNVVAADVDALTGLRSHEARDAIIAELRRYLDFEVEEIDRERSFFRPNDDAPLFLNTVGSWQFRPETRTDQPEYESRWVHAAVHDLYLAGDYCRSKVDLVCLEGAVTTGIAAARAVATSCGRAGDVPEPKVPPEVSPQACEQAKAMLAPWLALAVRQRRPAPGRFSTPSSPPPWPSPFGRG